MLLTRPPLYSQPEGCFRARLACIRHAASVHSEPGSNSPVESCMRLDARRTVPPSAVISAFWSPPEARAPGGLDAGVDCGAVNRTAPVAGRLCPCRTSFPDGRRGRRGIDVDYFLYSVFKEPACRGHAASRRASCGRAPPARPLLASRCEPKSAFRRAKGQIVVGCLRGCQPPAENFLQSEVGSRSSQWSADLKRMRRP